jgi:hypothetical protein
LARLAGHLDIRALVPDILLFDRLAFPFPADEKERVIDSRRSERISSYRAAQYSENSVSVCSDNHPWN